MALRKLWLAVLVLVFSVDTIMVALAQTTYGTTCPRVEQIVRDTLMNSYNRDKTVPAALLRLHFHDCFVNGCDGSLLLDSTPTDGRDVEKFSLGNNNSARGYDVIDAVKSNLEAACPGVVSCADILAMAARDAAFFLGGPYYVVPTGRLDGRVSSRTLADQNLPSPFFTFNELRLNFDNKGLSVQDLVLLSGGHTIGRTKCAFFEQRVHNFNNTGKPDPTLNPEYVAQLKEVCKPPGATPSPTKELDKDSEFSFDNTYYKNLVLNNGLLISDHELLTSSQSAPLVRTLASDSSQFSSLKCNAVNSARITTPAGEVATF